MSEEESNGSPLTSGDDPITREQDDLLNRASLVTAVAEEVAGMNADNGGVLAITGRWGTGKTSLVNLIADRLEHNETVRTIRFNPWFFSGTDQLMGFFFTELASQLQDTETKSKRFKKKSVSIADKFTRYSATLSPLKFIPFAGAALGAAQGISSGVSQAFGQQTSVHEQRAEIIESLNKLNGRIVVLIDDIDRLSQGEIRDLLRLVRLNGSFPRIIYILCFDRAVVEAALNGEGIDGSTYLEKIVRTSVEVPPATDESIADLLIRGITECLRDIPVGPLDESRWADVFWQVVRPLFATLREIKRFLSSLSLTARAVGEEVGIVDLIALEAIRVQRPRACDLISQNMSALTDIQSSYGRDDGIRARNEPSVQSIIELFPDNVGRSVVRLIFPAAQLYTENVWHGNDAQQAWKRDRRVAHAQLLRYYFHRELPEGAAPSVQVQMVAHAIGDEDELRAALSTIPDQLLEDVLDRLLAHLVSVPLGAIQSTVTVLLEMFQRLRVESKRFFDPGADYAVLRPVLKLMEQVEDQKSADRIARNAYDATSSFYARHRFIGLLGERGSSQSRIISPELELELRERLRSDISSAPASVLEKERELLRTVLQAVAHEDNESGLPLLEAAENPRVTAQLLSTGLTTTKRQTMGSVQVHREDRLAWDTLLLVYGNEERFRGAVAIMQASITAGEMEVDDRLSRALTLFEKYSSGWRPEEF
ncbi:KAP family P-loop domain-containing protein [Streptomyces sp. 2112.3]|uniref:KAP family P-loop NTPase fold protein n=1 Tax=Streptomyces sp. 2112.3 TaxID=1881023 RepID=UPI00089547B9|nr:P-loop NTPase fold protein [Streptomyces sp. 2112.3]SEE88143.1 KAP family P-loop domain-containing protein [Streptomyces sp. 2112.3]